jgi:hypothetical protein
VGLALPRKRDMKIESLGENDLQLLAELFQQFRGEKSSLEKMKEGEAEYGTHHKIS